MRSKIIIEKADKGSATVIMSNEDHTTEVRRQLNQEENYTKLADDPTENFLLFTQHGHARLDG